VYTACTCTRPVHGRGHSSVHSRVRPYTAVHTCTRSVYTRRVVYGICTVVFTARTRPCTCRVHNYTARVHKRVYGLYMAVYSAVFAARTRPCMGRTRDTTVHTAVYGPYVHGPLHGRERTRPCGGRVNGSVNGRIYTALRTLPCTRPLHSREHGRVTCTRPVHSHRHDPYTVV